MKLYSTSSIPIVLCCMWSTYGWMDVSIVEGHPWLHDQHRGGVAYMLYCSDSHTYTCFMYAPPVPTPLHQKVKLGRFYAFFSFLWFFFDLRRRRRNARPPMPQYYKAPMHYSPKKCWDRQELLDGNPQNIYPLYSIILNRNRIKFLQNDQIFSIFYSKLLSLKSL